MPEICELEGGAGGIGKLLALFVAIIAEVQDQASNRIRGVNAVAEDGVPVRVPCDGLVLAESFQQIGEGLLGDIFRDDGLAQGNKDGVRRFAIVEDLQLVLPPGEQFEGALRIGDLIAKIVRPTAIGIHVVKMPMERFREKPGDDVEIFVVMRGEPAGVLLRLFGRAAGLGRVARDVNFVG